MINLNENKYYAIPTVRCNILIIFNRFHSFQLVSKLKMYHRNQKKKRNRTK